MSVITKDRKLGIFADIYTEDCFIIRNSEMVFARINRIGNKWVVWFYKYHFQAKFDKMKDALTYVNTYFIKWLRGE